MSLHISARKEEVADTVIVCGDPKRCRYISSYLDDVKLVSDVRGMLLFTGYYNGKRISAFSVGMGMPSMGIYAYELCHDYEVKKIIRIGTCGSYREDAKIGDVILVDGAATSSNFAFQYSGNALEYIASSKELNDRVTSSVYRGNIFTSDLFYNDYRSELIDKYNCVAVEMECFALFYICSLFNVLSSSVLTVSDNVVTGDAMNDKMRETYFDKALKIVLYEMLS